MDADAITARWHHGNAIPLIPSRIANAVSVLNKKQTNYRCDLSPAAFDALLTAFRACLAP